MTTKVGSDRIACRVLHNAGSARTLRLPALAIFKKNSLMSPRHLERVSVKTPLKILQLCLHPLRRRKL